MTSKVELEIKGLNFYYSGDIHALKNINLTIHNKSVTALIGPSGCGKTTLLRCFNRMHDLYPKHRYEGEILFQDDNLLKNGNDLINIEEPNRNGLPKADAVPHVYFRQCRLRTQT